MVFVSTKKISRSAVFMLCSLFVNLGTNQLLSAKKGLIGNTFGNLVKRIALEGQVSLLWIRRSDITLKSRRSSIGKRCVTLFTDLGSVVSLLVRCLFGFSPTGCRVLLDYDH